MNGAAITSSQSGVTQNAAPKAFEENALSLMPEYFDYEYYQENPEEDRHVRCLEHDVERRVDEKRQHARADRDQEQVLARITVLDESPRMANHRDGKRHQQDQARHADPVREIEERVVGPHQRIE